jgi:hypothetical protein
MNHPSLKLRRTNRDDIADFYERGHSLSDTGFRFGISASQVQQLILRDRPTIMRTKSTGKNPQQKITLPSFAKASEG